MRTHVKVVERRCQGNGAGHFRLRPARPLGLPRCILGYVHRFLIVALASLPLAGTLSASHAAELDLSATQVRDRLRARLDGRHFTARVRLEIREVSFQESRELDVWRDDDGARGERLMARFDTPYDMHGLGLLYIESIEGANDYFMYQPSVRRVRRIPETLVSQDVYGVDLEYLGFGIAQLLPVEIESMRVDTIGDRQVYRLTERALQDNQRFDERIVWIDPDTFVPVRTEHIRDGKTTLIARTLAVENRSGVTTPMETVYERPQDGQTVRMLVLAVDYEAEIPEVFFSTLQLTKAR